jgi:hypothetical protein
MRDVTVREANRSPRMTPLEVLIAAAIIATVIFLLTTWRNLVFACRYVRYEVRGSRA